MKLVVLSLTVGSIYALMAIGLVLIYRVTNTINFAHGAMATLGAYFMLTASGAHGVGNKAAFYGLNWFRAYPPYVGLIVAILMGALLGAVLYVALFVLSKDQSPLSVAVSTMGLMIGLTFACVQIWTDTTWIVPTPFDQGGFTAFDVVISWHQVATFGTLLVVATALFIWLTKTRSGIASRAVVEDPMAAELVGIDIRRLQLAVWMLAGGLAGLAGALVAHMTTLQPLALTGVLVKALAAAIIGGLVSLPLAVLGGILIAYVETWAQLNVSRPGVPDALVAAVVIAALILRGSAQRAVILTKLGEAFRLPQLTTRLRLRKAR